MDFHNADSLGRVRLNTNGTLKDINRLKITMQPGLTLELNDQDSLTTFGVVEYSEEEKIWVAKINWSDLRNA